MKGNRSASVRYPVTWKKRVLYIHNDASVLHFCHYYSPINATDTLLSLKYQKAKLETVIALYNEVFTTCVRITICQTNFLDNNMVCCAKHVIISSLPHLFINSQSTQHSLVPKDANTFSNGQCGYRKFIHHLDIRGYPPFSLQAHSFNMEAECPSQAACKVSPLHISQRRNKKSGHLDLASAT